MSAGKRRNSHGDCQEVIRITLRTALGRKRIPTLWVSHTSMCLSNSDQILRGFLFRMASRTGQAGRLVAPLRKPMKEGNPLATVFLSSSPQAETLVHHR